MTSKTLHVRVAKASARSAKWVGFVEGGDGVEVYRTRSYSSYTKAELLALRYVDDYRRAEAARASRLE